jgi:signal transduction histidine kinase
MDSNKPERISVGHRLVFELGMPFLVFLVFLLSGLIYATYYSYTRDLEQGYSIPQGIAANARESTVAFFDYLSLNLQLASRSIVYPFSLTSSPFLENMLRDNPAILNLTFFDLRGEKILSLSKATVRNLPEKAVTAEYIASVLETSRGRKSEPEYTSYGVPILYWDIPATYVSGETFGIMRATIDISTLWAIFSGLSAGGLAQVYVLDKEGTVLVSSNVSSDTTKEQGLSILRQFTPSLAVERYTGINGVPVIGAAQPVSGTNWFAVVEVPVSVLTARSTRTLIIFLSLSLLLLIMLAYEIYAFRKYLLQPLNVFVDAIKLFGEGKYATRVSLRIKNEFLLLADAVNEMASNIERQSTTIIEKLKSTVSDLDRSGKLLIRRDLELSRANDRLRELDVAKSEFVSVAAHQLRTPLSGIKWTLNLLINGDLGPLSAEQKEFLKKSYDSNERMISLINDLLMADRAESGKQRFIISPWPPLEIFDSVIFESLPLARKKKITIGFKNRPTDLPKVRVDKDKLWAAFQNLLENAVRYTLDGGTVTVDFEIKNGFLEVSIADSGIGIPEGQQDKIFTRFFRGSNAIKIETSGSGLGLYIARSIIERFGGKLWFKSSEHVGTTFYFTLPLA